MGEAEKLHNEALATFITQNYDQCIANLHKIVKVDEKRKNDPRVQHNLAIAEFFKGGCVETEKLTQDLKSLTKLDTKTKTKVDGKVKESNFLWFEFDGHELVVFHEAVLLCHSRQHAEAIRLLTPLFDNREVLDQLLQVRVAIVLCQSILAVYLRSPQLHEKVQQILSFLDSQKEFMTKHDEDLAKSCSSSEVTPDTAALCRTPLRQQYTLLSAHLQMLNKDTNGCLQTLHEVYRQGSSSDNPSAAFLPTLYFNNLGVVHMMMNKPNTTSLYFSKAVESFERYKSQFQASPDATSPSASLPGTGLGLSRVGSAMCHVLYNNAMCLLMREKYELAFRSLVVATPLLHTLPTLWLRLAQCCVKLHEQNVRKGCEEKNGQNSLVTVRQTPTGTVYQLPIRGSTAATTFNTSPDTGNAHMSLPFADKCLRNAHYLLLRQGRILVANNGSSSTAASKQENAEAGRTAIEGAEGTPEPDDASAGTDSPSTQEVLDTLALDPYYSSMLQAVYVDMAYVALAMNNPSIALHEAKQLLGMQNCSKENKIVTLSYIAEALCSLNKPSEALQILHGVNLQELLADKMSELNRRNAEALFVNLSIVHIMQNKYQRAQECIKQFISRSSSNYSILLQIYLDLVQGNRERVIELLSKHAHNFTVPI
jgi:CCR4-NOT transcription complex subunit 10